MTGQRLPLWFVPGVLITANAFVMLTSCSLHAAAFQQSWLGVCVVHSPVDYLKGWADLISVVVTSGMGQYLKDLKNPEEQLETLIKVGSLRDRITAAIMVRFADRDLQSLFALHCLWAISNALVKISICHLYVSYGGLRWDGELRSISRCKYSDFVRFASLPTRSWWLAWLTASPLFSRLFYSAYLSGTIGTKVLTGAVEIRMQHTFPLPLSTS